MIARVRDRHAVRRANKKSAIDAEKYRRTYRRILMVVFMILFVIAECFAIYFANERYNQKNSVKIAEEISIQLSLISLAISSGNTASYQTELNKFETELAAFSENDYVKKHQGNLIDDLNDYLDILHSDANVITQMMEIRFAIQTIISNADSINNTDADAAKIYKLVDDFNTLIGGLEKLDSDEFGELKKELSTFSSEMSRLGESVAVCMGVCATDTLKNKELAINDLVNQYRDKLLGISETISLKYNPNQLIRSLSDYVNV